MSKNSFLINSEVLNQADQFVSLFGSWKITQAGIPEFVKTDAASTVKFEIKSIEAKNVGRTDSILTSKQTITLALQDTENNKDFYNNVSSSLNFETRFADYASFLTIPSDEITVKFFYSKENISYEQSAEKAISEKFLLNFYEPLEKDLIPKTNVTSLLDYTLAQKESDRNKFANLIIPYESIAKIDAHNQLFQGRSDEEKDLFDQTQPYPYDIPFMSKLTLASDKNPTQATYKLNGDFFFNQDQSYDIGTLLQRWLVENSQLFTQKKEFAVFTDDSRQNPRLTTFDLVEWLNYEAPSKLGNLSSNTKVLQASVETPNSVKMAVNNYDSLINFAELLTKKSDEFVENYTKNKSARSFIDSLNGLHGKSEIIFYKIQKFEGTNTNTTPVQTILIPNSGKRFDYYDTQMFYNKDYTYVVSCLFAIDGCDYNYRSIKKNSNSSLEIVIDSFPTIKMVEVPMFRKTGRILANPPLIPNIEFVPLRRQSDKIKVLFTSNYGHTREAPISLTREDDVLIRNLLSNSDEESVILFDDTSINTRFEIYYSLAAPIEQGDYSSFRNNLFGSAVTAPSISDIVADSAATVLGLTTDKVYYFIMVARNRLGLCSNPSPIYRVVMNFREGISYPTVEIYDPPGKAITRKPSNIMTKFINIRPTILQATPDYYKSGLLEQNADGDEIKLSSKNKKVFLGITDDNIFGAPGTGKKFKFRFRSKNTNKVFDLNVTCKNTRKTTGFDFSPGIMTEPPAVPLEKKPEPKQIDPHILLSEISPKVSTIDPMRFKKIESASKLLPFKIEETTKINEEELILKQQKQITVLFPNDN